MASDVAASDVAASQADAGRVEETDEDDAAGHDRSPADRGGSASQVGAESAPSEAKTVAGVPQLALAADGNEQKVSSETAGATSPGKQSSADDQDKNQSGVEANQEKQENRGGGGEGKTEGEQKEEDTTQPDYVYSGERDKQGLPHGMGRCTYTQTGLVYEGEFEHGVTNGEGRLTWPNGSVYFGLVENGQVLYISKYCFKECGFPYCACLDMMCVCARALIRECACR